MLACNLERVAICCDGLPYGACARRTGIRYLAGVPLCPDHFPADGTPQ